MLVCYLGGRGYCARCTGITRTEVVITFAVIGKTRMRECLCAHQVPEVEGLPCTRRLLCELEAAARTSDNYLPRPPKEHEGRDPSEEETPEEVDPISEIQIEAVRALYR